MIINLLFGLIVFLGHDIDDCSAGHEQSVPVMPGTGIGFLLSFLFFLELGQPRFLVLDLVFSQRRQDVQQTTHQIRAWDTETTLNNNNIPRLSSSIKEG